MIVKGSCSIFYIKFYKKYKFVYLYSLPLLPKPNCALLCSESLAIDTVSPSLWSPCYNCPPRPPLPFLSLLVYTYYFPSILARISSGLFKSTIWAQREYRREDSSEVSLGFKASVLPRKKRIGPRTSTNEEW